MERRSNSSGSNEDAMMDLDKIINDSPIKDDRRKDRKKRR
jgi:hypothetical protein